MMQWFVPFVRCYKKKAGGERLLSFSGDAVRTIDSSP